MKTIVVSVQNGLLAEGIIRTLKESGEFRAYKTVPGKSNSVLWDCESLNPDILLMEVSHAPDSTLPKRLEEGAAVRKALPHCKLVLLCDENAAPDIARQVSVAKQDGRIDNFFYSSVTGSYLTAALSAL